jgi:hypothetical protein
MARAQLAVLPGTTHEGALDRAEWLSSMMNAFLPLSRMRSASTCGCRPARRHGH